MYTSQLQKELRLYFIAWSHIALGNFLLPSMIFCSPITPLLFSLPLPTPAQSLLSSFFLLPHSSPFERYKKLWPREEEGEEGPPNAAGRSVVRPCFLPTFTSCVCMRGKRLSWVAQFSPLSSLCPNMWSPPAHFFLLPEARSQPKPLVGRGKCNRGGEGIGIEFRIACLSLPSVLGVAARLKVPNSHLRLRPKPKRESSGWWIDTFPPSFSPLVMRLYLWVS